MLLKPITSFVAALTLAASPLLDAAPAFAGNYGIGGHVGGIKFGPKCTTGSGKTGGVTSGGGKSAGVTIIKPVTINKNINVNTNININKNVNVNNNVNINKNININKTIIINKGDSGSGAEAEAEAGAWASAQSKSDSNAQAVSGSSSYSDTTVNNYGGAGGAVAVAAEEACHVQEASVVKAIHVVCVAGGQQFAASHMVGDTWISAAYEGEVARCIPGATIKAIIGDVLQSDQGMAGTYSNGQVLTCGVHEALRHYKDGMLKCAPAVAVPDCTERTNLRRYGTGDMFFSYRAQVCVKGGESHEARASDLDLSGMSLEGGVSSGN